MFSFLTNQRYEVKYLEVKNDNIIIEFQGIKYEVELFNITMNHQASDYMEEVLVNSNKVSIELDDEIQQEDKLIAYVFVDDILLQQILIDEKLVKLKIDNPNYKYFNQDMEIATYAIKYNVSYKQDYHGLVYLIGFYVMTLVSLKVFSKVRK